MSFSNYNRSRMFVFLISILFLMNCGYSKMECSEIKIKASQLKIRSLDILKLTFTDSSYRTVHSEKAIGVIISEIKDLTHDLKKCDNKAYDSALEYLNILEDVHVMVKTGIITDSDVRELTTRLNYMTK